MTAPAATELDRLFAATHAPPPQPAFGPTALLATTWRAAGSLAAYTQQDAHECLIALLNAAHASVRGSTLLKRKCIIHSTLGGLLQRDMRCPRCNSLSETVDPCLDISLGLSPGQNTLSGCLNRYMGHYYWWSFHEACSLCKTDSSSQRTFWSRIETVGSVARSLRKRTNVSPSSAFLLCFPSSSRLVGFSDRVRSDIDAERTAL
jgi:Ubiquitin carboxyl-terminal hydrolase